MKNYLFILTLLLCNISINLNSIYGQTQIGLDLLGDENNILFGSSVSISADGNRIAVGAELFANSSFELVGSVKVYEWVNGNWMQMGNNINGTEDFDFLGHAVSLSSDGNIIAISGSGSSNGPVTGKVKVFEWLGDTWVQQGSDIQGEAIGDWFGHSLALSSDGSHVVTGGIYNDGNGTDVGHVRVHTYSNGNWVQVGNDIDGEQTNDFFGISVDISSNGNRIAIGASNSDGSEIESGTVKIFEWMNNTWTQMGNNIDGEASYDLFGADLSLSSDGTRVAVGAINNDGSGTFLGHVRVLEWINGDWQQVGVDIDGTTIGTWFGGSVSLSADGNRLVVGAALNDMAYEDAGQVKIFDWINSAWVPSGISIEGEQAMGWLGIETDISADGERIIVAARNYVDVGNDQGKVRVYDFNNMTAVTPITVPPSLIIYPNPCSEQLFVEDTEIDNIRIFDMYGILVKEVKGYPISIIDVSNLASGIYYLKISMDEHSVMKKIIKI
ncbi:MAG: T9SS type A sorting domain-containing protein [Bacteroidetes bacterium]|nr:T9SS type A sorting domain-containing protein [Bacteroidota bacterium]